MPPYRTHSWVVMFQTQRIGYGIIRLRPYGFNRYIILFLIFPSLSLPPPTLLLPNPPSPSLPLPPTSPTVSPTYRFSPVTITASKPAPWTPHYQQIQVHNVRCSINGQRKSPPPAFLLPPSPPPRGVIFMYRPRSAVASAPSANISPDSESFPASSQSEGT